MLIVVGALFLLLPSLGVETGALLWPFFVILPGLLFFGAVALWGRDAAGLAVPGSIITTIGGILLFQSVTGRFETWAYAWGLIPAAVGVGLYLDGRIAEDAKLARAGERLALVGLTLFLAFALFFEVLVFARLGGSWLVRVALPVVLIGAGAWLFVRDGIAGAAGSGRGGEPPREPGGPGMPQT